MAIKMINFINVDLMIITADNVMPIFLQRY